MSNDFDQMKEKKAKKIFHQNVGKLNKDKCPHVHETRVSLYTYYISSRYVYAIMFKS